MTIQSITEATRDLLDEKEAGLFLDTAPGTLSVWRSTGRYNLPFHEDRAQGAIPPCRSCSPGWKSAPAKPVRRRESDSP
jgi:hypothetical protein